MLAALAASSVAACRDPARPPSAAARPSPPATAQGSVNPDAGVTSYACLDGQTITAGYPDRETAVVTYKDHAYTLKRVPSASGARYTGYGLQWWVKGAHAAIVALKPGEEVAGSAALDCAAASPAPAAEPGTPTSFAPVRAARDRTTAA
jgi:membrane-bound inhibitor of C-type lysozyme